MPPSLSSVIWCAQKPLLTTAVSSLLGQSLPGPSDCHSPQHSPLWSSQQHQQWLCCHFLITLLMWSLWSLGVIWIVGWLLLCFFLSSPASCSLLLVLWSHTSLQELMFTHHLRGHQNPVYNPSSPHQPLSEATYSYLDISIFILCYWHTICLFHHISPKVYSSMGTVLGGIPCCIWEFSVLTPALFSGVSSV